MNSPHPIEIRTAGGCYPVIVGRGAHREITHVLSTLPKAHKIALIADQTVFDLHGRKVLEYLPTAAPLTFPPGEASKSLSTYQRLTDELAAARIGREDFIVTLGGGVAGDLGGFVAATWLRGIRYVQIATTLEAAVDASVGGKTAVNHPAGKNLIGAFHQPCAVLIDLDFLETLPQRDFTAALAESVKHAAIRDFSFLNWHEQNAEAIVARDPEVTAELIAWNVRIKADVVSRDEREQGLRAILNYGHTLGHAIEHVLEYELRHGECVALGIVAENEIACALGWLGRPAAERIRNLLARLGLPLTLPRKIDERELLAACGLDKKVRRGRVHFVLLRDIARPERTDAPTEHDILAALSVLQGCP